MKTTSLLILLLVALATPCAYAADSKDYGYATAMIRAGGSASDLTVWICRPEVAFDYTWRPDLTPIENQNPDCLKMQVLPDGRSEPELLQAGGYSAYLQNGNRNQPEVINFTVGGGYTTYLPFLGSAVAKVNHEDCIIPEHLEYRFRDWIPETTRVVCYPEVNHTITVNDTEPWIETVYHPEVNHTVYHPEINHTERQIETWQIVTPATPATGVPAQWDWRIWDYEPGHVHARHEHTPSQIDFWYDGDSYHITGNYHDPAFMVTPGTPAVWGWVVTTPWEPGYCMDAKAPITRCTERLVIDSPAWPELVVDKEAWVDEIPHDGTTHEETVVDEEAYCEIVTVTDGYWTGWSQWSIELPVEQKGREIESMIVERVNKCCCRRDCGGSEPALVR